MVDQMIGILVPSLLQVSKIVTLILDQVKNAYIIYAFVRSRL